MRLRTLILFAIALLLAGGTAILVRSWLSQRPTVAAVAPPPRPVPQKSIMVARAAIARGQILKPADLTARPWPDAAITGDYVVAGTEPAKSLVGAVAREPIAAGEPIIKTKIVVPGDRGFLAAVLQPGMRAVSVPVDATTDVSGFVFAGDRVDILITLPVPQDGANGNSGYQHKAAETVLHDVRVIAIDQHLDNKDGQAMVARNVTFEVTPKQSEIIAVASEIGKLSLSLRSLAAVKGQKSAVVAAADSHDDSGLRNVTLDSEVSQVLPKPFTSKLGPARAGEAAHLDRLVASGAIQPADRVAISASGAPPLADARVAAISSRLLRWGIVADARPIAAVPPNRAIVMVGRYAVTLPPCPNWSMPRANDFTNAPPSNFGCATAVNLGLMVASPGDLAQGRTLAAADGKPAAAAVGRYLNDKVVLPTEAQLGPIAVSSGGAPPTDSSTAGTGDQ